MNLKGKCSIVDRVDSSLKYEPNNEGTNVFLVLYFIVGMLVSMIYTKYLP